MEISQNFVAFSEYMNFKRYEDDLRVIFDPWPKLHLGLDAVSSQKILKGVYYITTIVSNSTIFPFLFWIEIVNCHVHCAMPVLLRITSLRRQATPMRQSSIPMLLFDRFRSSQKTSLLQDECRHLECPRLWLIIMIS